MKVDKLYERAVKEIAPYDCVSTSFLQRKFVLTHKDAEKLMSILVDKNAIRLKEGSDFIYDVLKK